MAAVSASAPEAMRDATGLEAAELDVIVAAIVAEISAHRARMLEATDVSEIELHLAIIDASRASIH